MEAQTKTVKMSDEVSVTAKEFFRNQYTTAELYQEKKIAELKEKITQQAQKRGNSVRFFCSDGIEFYTYTIKKENSLTTLNELKDFGALSGGEAWKFGYVTKEGKIIMLFGNQYVAKGRENAIALYEKVALYVKTHIGNEAIPFAEKN
jgi:hypothetical protein